MQYSHTIWIIQSSVARVLCETVCKLPHSRKDEVFYTAETNDIRYIK